MPDENELPRVVEGENGKEVHQTFEEGCRDYALAFTLGAFVITSGVMWLGELSFTHSPFWYETAVLGASFAVLIAAWKWPVQFFKMLAGE